VCPRPGLSLTRGSGSAATTDWWLINVQSGAATAMAAAAALTRAGLAFGSGPGAWLNGEIVFSARTGDVSSLWAIDVSSDGRRVTGSPRRLTAGVGTDWAPSVIKGPDGLTVYYANIDERANLYRLPLSGSPGTAALDRVTDAAADDRWPSVSADGRTLVFTSNRSAAEGAWLRDLASGRETPLTAGEAGRWATVSPDGQRVVYSATSQAPFKMVVRAIGGGATQPHPDGFAEFAWSWPSGHVLFGSVNTAVSGLRLVDPGTGKARSVIADPRRVFTATASCRPTAGGRARWNGRARIWRASSSFRSATHRCRRASGSRSLTTCPWKRSTCGRRKATRSISCSSATATAACGCASSIVQPDIPPAPSRPCCICTARGGR
jgi:WD40-like Beta Propeller Repeat